MRLPRRKSRSCRPPVTTLEVHGACALVVEDDPDVRAHTCEVLQELGYGFPAVADGAAAMAVLDENPRIDLIFTDVILAGAMNGRDIAERARQKRPALPVLFTSGYARETIVQNGRLEAGVELLQKPFTLPQLAHRIRDLLDGRPHS